jgi:very-short-patch-repair endonuclease
VGVGAPEDRVVSHPSSSIWSMDLDGALRQIAADQHGLAAVGQAYGLGATPAQVRWLIEGRGWERRTPRVLRLCGAPETIAQRCCAAVLDAGIGGALSHSSALAHWGVPGNLLEPFHVTRTRDRSDRPGRLATVHEPTLLPAHHVVTLDGVATVLPARALLEVAGMRRRGADLPWWVDRIARMVDTAWAQRLVSGPSLRAMVAELSERGRPGLGVMRQVLAERPDGYVPPASGLEARVLQLLARSGEPPMERQVDLGDDIRWIGRVDFVDRRNQVVLEVQSERFHASHLDRQLDAERIRRLEGAGWSVAEVTDVDVWHRPDRVISALQAARAHRHSRPNRVA